MESVLDDSTTVSATRITTPSQLIPWAWWGNGVGLSYGSNRHAFLAWTDTQVLKLAVNDPSASTPVETVDDYTVGNQNIMPYGFIDYEGELWLRRKSDGRFMFIGDDGTPSVTADLAENGYCDVGDPDDEPAGMAAIPYDKSGAMTHSDLVVAFAAITPANDIKIGVLNKDCDHATAGMPADVVIDIPAETTLFPDHDVLEADIDLSTDTITLTASGTDHGIETGDPIIYTAGLTAMSGGIGFSGGSTQQFSFDSSAVDTTNDWIVKNGHGLSTGDRVYFNRGDTAPGGLFNDPTAKEELFYVIKKAWNKIRLARSARSADEDNYVDLTSAGSTSSEQHNIRVVIQDTDFDPLTAIRVSATEIKLAASHDDAATGNAINLTAKGSTGSGRFPHKIRRAQPPADRILRNNIAADEDGGIYVVHQHGLSKVVYDRSNGTLSHAWTNTNRSVGKRGSGTSPTILGSGSDKVIGIMTSHASENYPRLMPTTTYDELILYRASNGTVSASIDVKYPEHGPWSAENSLAVRGDDIYVAQYNGLADCSCSVDYLPGLSATTYIVNATGPDVCQQNSLNSSGETDFSGCISTPFPGVRRYEYDPSGSPKLKLKAENNAISINSVLMVADNGSDVFLYGYGKTLTEFNYPTDPVNPADLDVPMTRYFKHTGTNADAHGMYVLDPDTLDVLEFGDTYASGNYQCDNLGGFGQIDCPTDHPQFINTGLYALPLPNERIMVVGNNATDMSSEGAPIWVFEN